MASSATATFKIESWDEEPYAELDGGGKLAQATVRQSFSGEIEGDGSVTWLMCYGPDGTANFVGLQQVTGSIAGRSGSFVLAQTEGTFDGSEARGRLTIVPDSGTGDLQGLTGSGEFVAPRGGEAKLSLDYDQG